MPNNKKQENVDDIRKDFAKRVYDLYINAANGKIDTYDKFLTRLEWLEIDYSDALSHTEYTKTCVLTTSIW